MSEPTTTQFLEAKATAAAILEEARRTQEDTRKSPPLSRHHRVQQPQQPYPVVVQVLPMPSPPKRPVRIVVEGIMGAGKSHFIAYANSRAGKYLDIRLEPLDQWTNFCGVNLLAEAYRDPEKHIMELQALILITLGERLMQTTTQPIILQERSQRSVLFFLEAMLATGKLTSTQYAILQRMYQFNTSQRQDLESADMVIYLRMTPEKALERIKQRARDGESVVSLEYLRFLHDCHEALFVHKVWTSKARLVRVDTTHDSSAPDSYDIVLGHAIAQAIAKGVMTEDDTGLTEGPYDTVETGPLDVVVPPALDSDMLDALVAAKAADAVVVVDNDQTNYQYPDLASTDDAPANDEPNQYPSATRLALKVEPTDELTQNRSTTQLSTRQLYAVLAHDVLADDKADVAAELVRHSALDLTDGFAELNTGFSESVAMDDDGDDAADRFHSASDLTDEADPVVMVDDADLFHFHSARSSPVNEVFAPSPVEVAYRPTTMLRSSPVEAATSSYGHVNL
jgi:deoxyadenosine/deoxycytidine kinase